MKWFVAIKDGLEGEIVVREYSSRILMIEAVIQFENVSIEVICVWTEGE